MACGVSSSESSPQFVDSCVIATTFSNAPRETWLYSIEGQEMTVSRSFPASYGGGIYFNLAYKKLLHRRKVRELLQFSACRIRKKNSNGYTHFMDQYIVLERLKNQHVVPKALKMTESYAIVIFDIVPLGWS